MVRKIHDREVAEIECPRCKGYGALPGEDANCYLCNGYGWVWIVTDGSGRTYPPQKEDQ